MSKTGKSNQEGSGADSAVQALRELSVGRNIVPVKIEIPQQDYDIILVDMANSFYGNRTGCETIDRAREYASLVLKQAEMGMRLKDDRWVAWRNCPYRSIEEVRSVGWREALNKRLRVFHYDMKDGFIGAFQNRPQGDAPDDPDDMRRHKLSASEVDMMSEFKEQVLSDYRQLDTASDRAALDALAFWMVRNRRLIEANGDLTDKHVNQYKILTDTLGISGAKREGARKEEEAGSLAQLHKRYAETKKNYPEIEEVEIKEEFELLLQKVANGSISEMMMFAYIDRYGYRFNTVEEVRLWAEAKPYQADGVASE